MYDRPVKVPSPAQVRVSALCDVNYDVRNGRALTQYKMEEFGFRPLLLILSALGSFSTLPAYLPFQQRAHWSLNRYSWFTDVIATRD